MVLNKLRKWRVDRLIPFLIIIAVGTFLAIRANANVNQIKRDAKISCERSNENSIKLNQFIDALSTATLKVGAGNSRAIKDRVQTYQNSKSSVYKC